MAVKTVWKKRFKQAVALLAIYDGRADQCSRDPIGCVFYARRYFFYRMGNTAEGFAERIKRAVPEVEIVEYGTTRGEGDQLSNFWVAFQPNAENVEQYLDTLVERGHTTGKSGAVVNREYQECMAAHQ